MNCDVEATSADDERGCSRRRGRANLKVEIRRDQHVRRGEGVTAAWLKSQILHIARLAGVRKMTLGIALIGDEAMADLHVRYKQVPGTTDVLTFDLAGDPDQGVVEGDLAICLDEASRQAAERGHELKLEVLLYAVHGLLHLLGHDDVKPAEAAAMHEQEDDLLTQAGHGAVYRHRRPRR
ncbi:MAG: rRNA maturation RNase YbeY [Phycisphaeraceae bacterium]|nr:rRNA maturation RNase YbeY [Phycisphaeraceae bacterium]